MKQKSARIISGGEHGRMLFGKSCRAECWHDEPTNHLDMESIESLNTALNIIWHAYFVSHDREFVSSLATRIIEIT